MDGDEPALAASQAWPGRASKKSDGRPLVCDGELGWVQGQAITSACQVDALHDTRSLKSWHHIMEQIECEKMSHES